MGHVFGRLLFVFHFIGTHGLTLGSSAEYARKLVVLEEVLQGPLSERPITFYLDSAIPVESVGSFLSIEVLGKNGYQVVYMGDDDPLRWADLQPASFIKGCFMIHVVLFVSDPTAFFSRLPVTWNPDVLLLFSLAEEETTRISILNQRAYEGIRSLALIMSHKRKLDITVSEIGVFTNYPFSNRTHKVRYLGAWNSTTFETFGSLFPDRFASFEGQLFPLSTSFDDFPYCYNHSEDEVITHRGLGLDMVDLFSKKLNFTYSLTRAAPDDNWGTYENGSWNGLLGEIHHHGKIFTINYFTMNLERIQFFDASVPYWREGFGIALLVPPPLPKWRNVYLPFLPSVWILCLFTFVFTLVIMTVQDQLQPVSFFGGFGETWHYLLRGMFNQGVERIPEADWQRVFLCFWYIYCYIITAAYCSNLIAVLTIPVFPKRLTTLQEFANSQFRLAMHDYGEFVEGAIKSSTDASYSRIGKKFDLFPTQLEGLLRLNGTHYGYTDSYAFARYTLAQTFKNISETYFLHEQLYPGSVCWYFRLNSPWKYKFDRAITRVVEAGLVNFWLKNHYNKLVKLEREKKDKRKEETQVSLSLEHLASAFIILSVAWFLGAFVCVVEVLCYRQRPGEQSKRKKKKKWILEDAEALPVAPLQSSPSLSTPRLFPPAFSQAPSLRPLPLLHRILQF